MPRQTDDERLASLVARRNRTDAAIRRLKTKNEKSARAGWLVIDGGGNRMKEIRDVNSDGEATRGAVLIKEIRGW